MVGIHLFLLFDGLLLRIPLNHVHTAMPIPTCATNQMSEIPLPENVRGDCDLGIATVPPPVLLE